MILCRALLTPHLTYSFDPRAECPLPQSHRQPRREQEQGQRIQCQRTQGKYQNLRDGEYQPSHGQIVDQKSDQHPDGSHGTEYAVIGHIHQQRHDNTAHKAEHNILRKKDHASQSVTQTFFLSAVPRQCFPQQRQRLRVQLIRTAGGIGKTEHHPRQAEDIP